jgi:[acyl-carrier-protein] S-malonyltransferase
VAPFTVLAFEGQGARTVPGPGGEVELAALAPAEAQRAIVSHQVRTARAWLDASPSDHAVVGQSLGEVAGFVVAGALALDDALELATLRADLPRKLLPGAGWTMASFTRLPVEKAVAAADGLRAWVAARNAPSDCIVVAGADAFATFVERARATPNTYRELPVTAPYHTPVMAPVADAVAAALASTDVAAPSVEVVSPTGPRWVRTADDVRRALVTALTEPVAWSSALALASAHWPGARWRECGPSYSLHRFVWKNGLDVDWADAEPSAER